MNILPNSFLTSPILNAAVAAASAASSNPALLKQQNAALLQASVVPSPSAAALSAIITPKSGDRVCKCVVCEDPLHESDPQLFQMLAVRPSIGTPAGPFFPILETLTSTSAVRVPCCAICAQSLLNQWNDYEAKNVSINNRVYNLQAKFAARFQAKSAGPSGATPLFLLQQHSVLVNNGTTPSTVVAVAAMAESNSQPSSSSRDSSPQDEVLDLSMPSGAPSTPATPSSLSPQNLSRTNSSSSGQSGKVASVLPFGPSVASSSSASRPGSSQPPSQASQLPQARTVSLELAAAAVQSLPQYFNSSMTNLIKVTSNPISLTALKPSSFAPPPTSVLDNHSQPPASTPSPSSAKKPLFCCSLCDDTCTQLVPILLRPIANCPYFPTLISYVKSPQIDSSGRINVCDSCHRQLFQQWDVFQKQNKPVAERFYKLIKSSSPNSVLNFPFRNDLQSSSAGIFSHPGSAAASNVGFLHSNHHHIPSISSQSTATQQVCAVTRALFTCVTCSKDLLFEAASTLADHEPNSNAHLVFSMLTEPTSSREPQAMKKLVIQSAQEFSMLPFMPNANSTPAPIQPQLAMLIESGRVLCCFPCFESITRSSVTASSSFNFASNNTVPESVQRTVAGRSHRDPVNGNHVVKSSSYESSAADIAATYLCLACNTNKAQRLVETKENSVKEPFFPFLRDPNEPHGRARLCAACHLILETQWDAHEAGYVPYSQRTYGLPRPSSNGPNMSSNSTNLLLSKRPPSHHSHGGSSSPVVLSNLNSQVSSAHSNGQPTPPPLKIQISSPSVVVSAGVATSVNSNDNGHLLLTTVNNNNSTCTTTSSAATQLSAGAGPVAHPETQTSTETSTVSSSSERTERPNVDHELIFQTINEFIAQLGGPQSHISGNCVICGEYNQPGEAYQIFSNQQKVIISPELGQLPFFPMLKGLGAGPKKLKADNTHITCIFCYNSLIAQWAAYHASNFAEDCDPSTRIYNCRDFICFVCGVTTYRSLVRSISVKDFPFLVDHKRPPGSLSMHKGESVVTCLNCFDTLTHQWIENERMKVPLEMRQYNWMPVPQPPPPTSANDAQSTHSDSSRSTASNHLAILNHNGMTSGALTLVTKSLPSISAVTTIQGMMPGSNDTSTVRSGGTPVVTFNPSHTLAPLVAAAMAATPAVTHKESAHVNPPSDNFSATMSASSASFAEALRALARRHMHSTFPAVLKSSEPVPAASTANVLALNSGNHVNHNSNQLQSTAANHSINLSTLASVAAMAGSSHHSRHSSTETITTATTATVTTPNHAFVLNLASLPTADGRPHLLANHHGHSGEQKFILATTATPEQLAENGRTNGRLLLNPGANGSNLIIQFSGSNTRPRESPSLSASEHRPHQHNHHHHGHALAVHKSAHCPINSHGPRDHHGSKGHFASMRALSRLQASVVRATDSPEHRTTDSPAISHYDKCLSKVGLEESKLRRKRLARQQQLQQSFLRMKRARLSSLENSSELSGDEELEIVEDEEEDEDGEESTEEDAFGGESLLKFVGSILPPLPMDENPRKLSFLKAFGLTTKKVLQKQEFSRYLSRKMNRRISLKLSVVEEDEDSVLTKDVDDLGRIESSGILPTDDQLAVREEEKAEFMDALDLVPIEDEELVLKRELSWLAVIQERKIRRRRGYHFTRPLVNNFSNTVLRNWLPKLAGKCDLDNALLRLDEDETDEQKLYNAMQPLLDISYEEIGEPTPPKRAKASSSPEVTFIGHGSSHSHHQHIATTISRSGKHHRADHHHNPCLERSSKSPRSTASSDNHNQLSASSSNQNHSSQPQMLHHLPTSKLINSKQFAQEFHDSVLQETKLKMTHKQLSVNNIEPVSTAGNNGHQQPAMAHHNAQAPYHHTIIYSDSLRPNHDGALNHNHNHSDRPAPNSAPPVPSSGTMFRFPEKIGQMQEQMRKLQQKLAQISQETQYLSEKKNEIETSLHKLDEERSSCQAEMERLAQCLENSIV